MREARESSPDPGDAALLKLAAQEKRILVTIDTDFGALVYLAGAAHAGIIRLPDVPSPARIALMEQILARHGEMNLASAIVTVKGSRIRFTRAVAADNPTKTERALVLSITPLIR